MGKKDIYANELDKITEEIFIYSTLKSIKLHLKGVSLEYLDNEIQRLEKKLTIEKQK